MLAIGWCLQDYFCYYFSLRNLLLILGWILSLCNSNSSLNLTFTFLNYLFLLGNLFYCCCFGLENFLTSRIRVFDLSQELFIARIMKRGRHSNVSQYLLLFLRQIIHLKILLFFDAFFLHHQDIIQ